MEEVLLETGISRPMLVKAGCDARGIKVREKDKVTMRLEFKFEDETWNYHTVGEVLVITDSQSVYHLTGRQVWKLRKQIEFYRLYNRSFGRH
jgi:hypothetical protein